ncbi:uncharacterized protein LOC127869377 isoform X1 [Dreissena polymorpha]|uniref:Methyltransferase domain-containing protein n=1 Tax=Dreissena polymorpha TaxID=45954 RepID=A0A9D4MFN9_DREPO|nr:uncharacterized protein LOC127869377 isoform X1 [Dreissena polymorpha]KAH3875305.1 hypothetical protein DPMN_038568 [Dreissena polymorpha]
MDSSTKDKSERSSCYGNHLHVPTTDFTDLLRFLYEYQWLYDFKVTEIFTSCIWKKIPPEWMTTFVSLSQEELRAMPDGQYQESWPESLKFFIKTSQKYSLSRDMNQQRFKINKTCKQGQDCECSPYKHVPPVHNTTRFPSLQKEHRFTPLSDSTQCSVMPGSAHFTPTVVQEQLSTLKTLSHLDDKAQLSPLHVSQQLPSLDITQQMSYLNVSADLFPLEFVTHFSPLDPSDIDPSIRRGMSAKKLHEVCNMSSLVARIAELAGSDVIVDIGAGLGYLGQVLHHNYGLPVLGVEGQGNHTAGAEIRATHTDSCPFLHNTTCRITRDEQSLKELSSLVSDWFTNLPSLACTHMTGLQCGRNQMERPDDKHSVRRDEERNIVECPITSSKKRSVNSCYNASTKTAGTYETLFDRTNQLTQNTNQRCMAAFNTDMAAFNTDMAAFNTDCKLGQKSSNYISEAKIKLTENPGENCEHKHFNCNEKCEKPNSNTFESYNNRSYDCCNHGKSQIEGSSFCHHSNRQLRVCMIGLHCCGDLTPTILRYFVRTDWITSLCCVSCCYHRMEYSEADKCISNFPMSDTLGRQLRAFQQNHPEFRLSPFAMRLAAQETRSRWQHQSSEDHNVHTRNVAYRAILETCLQTGDYSLSKTTRKLVPRSSYECIESYSTSVFKHIVLPQSVSLQDDAQKFKETMVTLHDNFMQYFCLIEPITALQFLLQPVLESLVYVDRQICLAENGCHGNIVIVFDEFISPRNIALIAIKPDGH